MSEIKSSIQEIAVEIIKDFNRFLSIEKECTIFLKENNIENPYVTHAWLKSWWRGYGENKELFIICFWKNNTLIGFAPLMKYGLKFLGLPIKILGFISNHWVEQDIIITSEYREICLQMLKTTFLKEKNMIILSYFSESSQTFSALCTLMSGNNVNIKIRKMAAPYLALNESWQQYLKSRSYRFRSEYNKKKKGLESQGACQLMRSHRSSDLITVLKEIEGIIQNSWQGKKDVAILVSPQGRLFYQNLIDAWGGSGYIDISILRLNNKAIAYLVGFIIHKCFYVFDTGYDDQYRDMSPGMVIHNMLLEELHSDDIREFDFGYMADYKKRWTEDARVILDLLIFNNGPLGESLWRIQQFKEIIQERFIKKNNEKSKN